MAELVVVVVILAILAAIVIPDFTRRIEQGYRREAADLLWTIYNGERAYCFTKSQSVNNAQPNAPVSYSYYGALDKKDDNASWGNIFMDNPNVPSIPVEFTVTAGQGGDSCEKATFLATATYQRNTSRTMTVNQQKLWCGSAQNPDNCTTWPIP